jgi:hypothetical protein
MAAVRRHLCNNIGMRQRWLTGATGEGNLSTATARQPMGLAAYAGSAVWMSSYIQEPGIYRLDVANGDPRQELSVPGNARYPYGGLAFVPGYDMLASSFSQDQVRRFDLPASCNENTRPSANIVLQWSDGQEHALQYQPAYSNESVCIPRDKWASMYLVDGDYLPKSTGGTIRGLRVQTGSPVDASVVISGTELSGATLTRCGEGLWAVWSASPAGWTDSNGILPLDWHPRLAPGIAMEWKGTYTQTLRYQYQVVDPKSVSCAPDRTAWSNITVASGDYLPLPVGPKGTEYNGLLLSLAPGDLLRAEPDPATDLTQCVQEGMWLIHSDTHADLIRAYGTVVASWVQLPEGQLAVGFQGQGADEAHVIEWQAIGADEPACGKAEDCPWAGGVGSGSRSPPTICSTPPAPSASIRKNVAAAYRPCMRPSPYSGRT